MSTQLKHAAWWLFAAGELKPAAWPFYTDKQRQWRSEYKRWLVDYDTPTFADCMSEAELEILANRKVSEETRREMLKGKGVLHKYENFQTVMKWVTAGAIKVDARLGQHGDGSYGVVLRGASDTVTVTVGRASFSEPRAQFPSDTMIANIMLIMRNTHDEPGAPTTVVALPKVENPGTFMILNAVADDGA